MKQLKVSYARLWSSRRTMSRMVEKIELSANANLSCSSIRFKDNSLQHAAHSVGIYSH